MIRRLAPAMMAIGLSSCAHAASSGEPSAARDAAPVPIVTMSAHGSLHLALSAPSVAADFDAAQCSLASPYDENGGLRVTATSSTAPENTVAIVASSVARDGDVTWKPDGTQARITAPARISIRVPQGIVFTGAPGSTTTVHVEGGGRRGTATFAGATYVSQSAVGDATGTISWSCT